MRRAGTRVGRSGSRPSLNTLRGKHSIDVVVGSWVSCCWKVWFFLVIPFQMQLFFLPLHAFLQNVDVFGPYFLHSFWFSPVFSASSRAFLHPGFTWLHGNNAPAEGNPFIPVRNQSVHTSASSFSPPVPCRLLNRSLRKPRRTRYGSIRVGRFKNSLIAANSCRTMDMMLNSHLFFFPLPINLPIIQLYHQYINKWNKSLFFNFDERGGCSLCGTRTHVQ